MGKRKRKKASSLLWKAARGFFQLLFHGLVQSIPTVIILGIGFAIFWGIRENLYADPGFLVQAIRIVPEDALTPQKLQELDRLYRNRNLFKISPTEVAEVVERDPKIKEARVFRDFPQSLRIEVRDRNPFAQVQFSANGGYYAIAEDGVILGRDPARDHNLLLVEVFESGDLHPELGRKVPIPGFDSAAGLIKVYPTLPLSRSETLERLRLDHLGNVSLLLKDGPELRLGREPMKKLHALNSVQSLLKGPERDRMIYVELQYQDLIVKKR